MKIQTAYYTYNGNSYNKYNYNANDWKGFVKDSITLYTLSGISKLAQGTKRSSDNKYYKLVEGVYVEYKYNANDWDSNDNLKSGVELYAIRKSDGVLVQPGEIYNSSKIYYTYKNFI